jgi:hypothetical protein
MSSPGLSRHSAGLTAIDRSTKYAHGYTRAAEQHPEIRRFAVKKYNHLALTTVMLLMGVLLIVGSVLASVGTTLFPFDQYVGTRAPVAGIAFGTGILLAAKRPEENLTWVRAAIVYCVFDVLYEIVYGLFFGGAAFGLIPLVVSIIFAAVIIWLYPRRGDLMPRSSTSTAPAAR